jgi:hypothetical protein
MDNELFLTTRLPNAGMTMRRKGWLSLPPLARDEKHREMKSSRSSKRSLWRSGIRWVRQTESWGGVRAAGFERFSSDAAFPSILKLRLNYYAQSLPHVRSLEDWTAAALAR